MGNENMQHVTLWNDSDCCLRYKLLVEQRVVSLTDGNDESNDRGSGSF